MNLVYAIVAPIVFAVAAPMVMQMLGGAAGGLFLPSLRHMLRGGILMMPPSKHYGLAGAAAMTAATSGAGAGAAAAATGAGGPGAGGVATSSIGYMAPVVGTTVLQNPVAQQVMRQRIMQTTAPTTVAAAVASKPMIREVKHPRLETAYHIAKAAITGKPPEWELSRKRKQHTMR